MHNFIFRNCTKKTKYCFYKMFLNIVIDKMQKDKYNDYKPYDVIRHTYYERKEEIRCHFYNSILKVSI